MRQAAVIVNLTGLSQVCKIVSFGPMDVTLTFFRNFTILATAKDDIPVIRMAGPTGATFIGILRLVLIR